MSHGSYLASPQYPGICEPKSFCDRYGVWIRKLDCQIAERFFGYQWLSCTPRSDFCGNMFSVILTKPPLNGQTVLEPDTRVPNYSTNLKDAADIVYLRRIKELPAGNIDDLCRWICEEALRRDNGERKKA